MASEWDLVIVDEAHRMGAHFFGAELGKTKRFLLGEQLGRIARHLLLMTATPHAVKEDGFQSSWQMSAETETYHCRKFTDAAQDFYVMQGLALGLARGGTECIPADELAFESC